MKKLFTLIVLGFFLFLMVSSPGFSQDTKKLPVTKKLQAPKKLLDQVINALGGRTVMEAIIDTTFSGTIELVQMGLSGPITFTHKEPNMIRQDMELMGMAISSAYDGKEGWFFNPQTSAIEDLPASALEDAKNEALGFGNSWMLFPEKHGIVFTEKDKETVEGIEYLVLEMTYENGDTSLYYIDPGTFLPFKMISRVLNQMGIMVEQETIMRDYKVVNGLKFAYSIIIFQDGEKFGSMVADEVKFNSGIEDSFFKKQ